MPAYRRVFSALQSEVAQQLECRHRVGQTRIFNLQDTIVASKICACKSQCRSGVNLTFATQPPKYWLQKRRAPVPPLTSDSTTVSNFLKRKFVSISTSEISARAQRCVTPTSGATDCVSHLLTESQAALRAAMNFACELSATPGLFARGPKS